MATALESKLARLTVDAGSSVARIALRNPPLNVIDIPMMEELAQTLGDVEARSDISVVLLSGEGKAFSAGGAVAGRNPRMVRAVLLKFHTPVWAPGCRQKVHPYP